MDVSGRLHDPAALPPGWAPSSHWIGGCGGEEKKFITAPPPVIEPQSFSLFADWSIPDRQLNMMIVNI
jgi:hypothetical protein